VHPAHSFYDIPSEGSLGRADRGDGTVEKNMPPYASALTVREQPHFKGDEPPLRQRALFESGGKVARCDPGHRHHDGYHRWLSGRDAGGLFETLDVVRRVRFDSAFTFIYSKRSGTPAAEMEHQVPEDEVKENFDVLLKEVQRIGAEKAEELAGRVFPVLIEQQNEQDASLVTGRLSNNSVVHVPGGVSLVGKIVDVRLTECKGFYYLGQIEDENVG